MCKINEHQARAVKYTLQPLREVCGLLAAILHHYACMRISWVAHFLCFLRSTVIYILFYIKPVTRCSLARTHGNSKVSRKRLEKVHRVKDT